MKSMREKSGLPNGLIETQGKTAMPNSDLYGESDMNKVWKKVFS